MKFSVKDFFSKCEQICSFLRICAHLLKKLLTKKFICIKWLLHRQRENCAEVYLGCISVETLSIPVEGPEFGINIDTTNKLATSSIFYLCILTHLIDISLYQIHFNVFLNFYCVTSDYA